MTEFFWKANFTFQTEDVHILKEWTSCEQQKYLNNIKI
jgi:hypothetical protein